MSQETIEQVENDKIIYLNTKGRRTSKPHTVELWFAYTDGRIYLSHEGKHTDWMKNIAKDGRVKAKIGKVELEGVATILGEGTSKELGKKALYEKYYGPASKEVIDDWFELSTLVQLTLN